MRGVFLFGGMNLREELEERIREIVREEMAAREERPEKWMNESGVFAGHIMGSPE